MPDLPPDALSALSVSQRAAVTSDADVALQILAGPGSGKTRVLTTRVAWLLAGADRRAPIAPGRCVVVTFTNKAAREMRRRLCTLLGEETTERIVLGTFHATCARYLRRAGRTVGVPSNFTIADVDDVKRMVRDILDALRDTVRAHGVSVKAEEVISAISAAKSRGLSAAQFRAHEAARAGTTGDARMVVAAAYSEYERRMCASDALDFDDLLLHGVRLFRERPQLAQRIDHVLVDEFQDTNAVQYELMRLMAACGRVSVVGDPDQSIYSWRNADVTNIDRMLSTYPTLRRVVLEENFRSTASILDAAAKVMQQDTLRIDKGLYTAHAKGTSPAFISFRSVDDECAFIALEIERQMHLACGVLNHGDICVLLRFNALSRGVETALQRRGIPYRVMGGAKFFERAEVKDLLAYLSLADNPAYAPAVLRVVNTPRRGVGPKSVAELAAFAEAQCDSLFAGVEKIVGMPPHIRPAFARPALVSGLASFVRVVQTLRRSALEVRFVAACADEQGMRVDDLLHLLLTELDYETYLRKEEDFETRWENVQELISNG
ncbi:DNA helicase [Malassezia sp. CBS 17886]|nr:DNA helicase [Malassezia sp. CBS 17886]